MTNKPAPAANRQPKDHAAPDSPTEIKGGGWWATAKRAFAEFRADDMMSWAAALTYYAVLSLFPALLALVSLIGVFGKQPDTTNSLLDIIASIGPQSTVDALEPMVQNLVSNKGGAGALLSFGLVAAIWSASGYIGAFFKASNAIYEVEEGRKFFKLRPIQLALTVLFLLVTAFGMIVFVASGSIVQSVAGVVGLGDTAVSVWTYAKWPVLGLVVALMLALLYWAAPNVKQPKLKWVSPGGFVGLVVLVIASALFAFYVTNFNSAGATYGALAAVPIGLTWLWICNLAILFGAEFDAELERQRRIEGGMRPVDAEPFLPHRDEPKETKDGADLAREQLAEGDIEQRDGGGGNGTDTRREEPRAGERPVRARAREAPQRRPRRQAAQALTGRGWPPPARVGPPQPTGEERLMAEGESNTAEAMDDESVEQEMKQVEENPPENLEDWPGGKAKYKTFGGPEAESGYGEGPTEKLGPPDLQHHEDGSVTIEGEKVDNPDEYKGEPIPGGPTDPDAPPDPGFQDDASSKNDES